MLSELRIRNFAIIEDLQLRLHPGLTVFTGETGAGKSIIFDAVEMLLGNRGDSTWIRAGAKTAVVEGTFLVPVAVRPALHALLEREELLDDPETVVLCRELRGEGRHVARVNGRVAPLALLRELGEYLVDLHGQSEHLSLLRVRQHARLLDRFAGAEATLAEYQHTYREWQQARQAWETLQAREREAARQADLLRYQIREIDDAGLTADEEACLRAERQRLANVQDLALLGQRALAILDEGTTEAPSMSDLLGQAARVVRQLVEVDPAQAGLEDKLDALGAYLAEVNWELHGYAETLEADPHRLNDVIDRLELIQRLKRKYGASLAQVLAFAEEARRQLEEITHAEEKLLELKAAADALRIVLARQAVDLSNLRQHAAERLAHAVENELASLHMPGARFAVQLTQTVQSDGLPLADGRQVAFHALGMDQVEFLIAPNPGEGLKPLAKTASGGESARLMLALENVLADADQTPTLIFDEIDQGIGGRVGTQVGRKLWDLARAHQVLCITHLPQVAACAETHWHVAKQVVEGRTQTLVRALNTDERRAELAQMLGGVSDGTLRSATEMLDKARQLAREPALAPPSSPNGPSPAPNSNLRPRRAPRPRAARTPP